MEEKLFCQSCAMPLTGPDDFGREENGAKNIDYCQYCYMDGKFTGEQTMEEMIEICIPHTVGEGLPYKNEEEARKSMLEFFPKLRRWGTA